MPRVGPSFGTLPAVPDAAVGAARDEVFEADAQLSATAACGIETGKDHKENGSSFAQSAFVASDAADPLSKGPGLVGRRTKRPLGEP